MKLFNNRFGRYIISLCCLILGLSVISAGAGGREDVSLRIVGVNSDSTAALVWVEQSGACYDLYVSEYHQGVWQPEQLVIESKLMILTPTMARDDDGHVWVVWSGRSGTATDLYYSVSQTNGWSAPVKIETHLVSSLSPVLTVDRHNQIWLAWAGFDGDDDIFFSRWNGADWDLPARVNIDNVTPDLFPVFGIGPDGRLWLQWSGYENGGYKQLRSTWNGTSWMAPKTMTAKAVVLDGYALKQVKDEDGPGLRKTAGQGAKVNSSTIELPDFLINPDQATFYMSGARREMQTLPLRDFYTE